MFKPKPRFDQLDQYLVRREYGLALEAITEEIKRRPESFNLLLRQAEILGLAGDREQAISVYRQLAQHYAKEGFYARAIAVTNKILRLDPTRKEVTRELADLIARQQEMEKESRDRLIRAATPPPPMVPPLATIRPTPEAPEPIPAPPATLATATEITAIHAVEGPPQQIERERDASRFFSAFPRGALEDLLTSTCVRSFGEGETIVREGEPGLSLFLIEAGSVEVRTQDPSGRHVLLAQLGPGEFFGEVAVLTGRPRTATIVAREAVTLIEISREDLDRIAADFPDVRTVLEEFYRQRAQATVEAMLQRLRKGHD